MIWKAYRESQGSPAKHEVVICHDSRDTDHPFIKDRVILYEKAGKKVTVKPVFPGAKHGSKKPAKEKANDPPAKTPV